MKASINEKERRTKWEDGTGRGHGHSFSAIPDLSQILEVSSDSDDDFSDFGGKVKTELRLNYKQKNKSNELMLERISESGANLRKRIRQEEILRSGFTRHTNKRMKFSSRDLTKTRNTLDLKTPSAEKVPLQRSCTYKKANFVVLEVSSDTDNASSDVDVNHNDPKDINDDRKLNNQQLVNNQPTEGIQNERICAGGSTERDGHDSGAKYPSDAVLPKSSGTPDFLWQVNKEEFLSMFGLCTHSQADELRARTATAALTGPSSTRLRRCRKNKVK